jgi:hypothetical protein
MGKQTINDMYLNALQEIGNWTTISDWAIKFSEMYPDQLEKAEKQAAAQKQETTGLREIAARISSQTSRNEFLGRVEVDTSDKPRRVRWLSDESAKNHEIQEQEEDIKRLTRKEKEKIQYEELSTKDKYRMDEFVEVISQLNKFFGTDFELEHSKAIMNSQDPGDHHPDNIQILLRSHNRTKSDSNWVRFSVEEQLDYITKIVQVQMIISEKMKVDIDKDVLEIIFGKIKNIY